MVRLWWLFDFVPYSHLASSPFLTLAHRPTFLLPDVLGPAGGPRQPWTETVTEFRSRLKGICEHINANHDVEGLCRGFPGRLQKLIDAQGDRIGK